MQDPGETEAERLKRDLEKKYPGRVVKEVVHHLNHGRTVTFEDGSKASENEVFVGTPLNDNQPTIIGDVYLYEGKPGRIRKNGVEVEVASLTDAEKVTAGEQFLKRYSQETGVAVSELRRDVAAIALETTHQAMLKGSAGGRIVPAQKQVQSQKPPHLHLVGNRHERRKEAALQRRK